jgi:hypothetical protein
MHVVGKGCRIRGLCMCIDRGGRHGGSMEAEGLVPETCTYIVYNYFVSRGGWSGVDVERM